MQALTPSLQDVWLIHDRCHFGVDHTLELAQERFGSSISKKMVKQIVSRCDRCARIDPAITFSWDHGVVAAAAVWQCWAADITHVQQWPYLSVVDTASGFTMWQALRTESAQETCDHLRQLFSEFGAPESLLSDNGTIFHSRLFQDLLRHWEVTQELTCAYRPQGNGVVEQVHHTVKRMVTRTNGTVEEAVFWLNNTTGEKGTSPFEMVFSACARKPGISMQRIEVQQPLGLSAHHASNTGCEDLPMESMFMVGRPCVPPVTRGTLQPRVVWPSPSHRAALGRIGCLG